MLAVASLYSMSVENPPVLSVAAMWRLVCFGLESMKSICLIGLA